jgi:hypothetical protein
VIDEKLAASLERFGKAVESKEFHLRAEAR